MLLLLGVSLSGLAQAQAPTPSGARPEALTSADERGNPEMLRARLKDVKVFGTKKPDTGGTVGALSPQAIELLRASQAERKRAEGEAGSTPFKVKGVGDKLQSRIENSRKGIRADEVTVTEWMGLVRRAANSTARATAMRKMMPGRALGTPTSAVRGRGNLLGRKAIGSPSIGSKALGAKALGFKAGAEKRSLPMSGGQPSGNRPRIGPKPQ